MANTRVSELAPTTTVPAGAQLLLAIPSPTVTKTAATISFAATDKSLNDSDGSLVAAGFAVGDRVRVTGAGSAGNNVFSAAVTAASAGKLVLDAPTIVDEAAGASVTVAKWVSVRIDREDAIAELGGGRSLSVQTVASSPTVTPASANDLVEISAQAEALTVADPSGSPANGWGMVLRIKDDGSARAITWGSGYRAIGVALPTTTVAGKQHYVAVVYNGGAAIWDVVAVGVQA